MALKVRLGSEEEHRLWDVRNKELVPALEQEVRNNIIVRCCTLSQTSNYQYRDHLVGYCN